MTTATEAVGEHHWEISWAPIVVSTGITFVVPLAFTSYFVYELPLLAALFAGLGTPLLLAGVAKWIHEGATQKLGLSHTSDLGIGIFIVSEILIFASLFASYWTMRIASGTAGEPWPPAGTPNISLFLPLTMTVILVSSSVTYQIGEQRFEAGERGRFQRWLGASIVLGLTFLGFTAYEYVDLVQQGFTPNTNSFSTALFTLTGFHAAHVLVGALAFTAMLVAVAKGSIHVMFVKSTGIYWHFVDIVWFFVASQVYLW